LANNLFRVIPKKNDFTKDFLSIFLDSVFFQGYIKESMNGAAMPAISFGMIKNIIFSFPKSLKTQKQIVKKLDELSGRVGEYEAILRSKIAGLEELKKSVLEKAFSGEL